MKFFCPGTPCLPTCHLQAQAASLPSAVGTPTQDNQVSLGGGWVPSVSQRPGCSPQTGVPGPSSLRPLLWPHPQPSSCWDRRLSRDGSLEGRPAPQTGLQTGPRPPTSVAVLAECALSGKRDLSPHCRSSLKTKPETPQVPLCSPINLEKGKPCSENTGF